MGWTITLSCWVPRLPDERQVLLCCCTERREWKGFFWASCSVCSSPCTRFPWQGRVSHGFISDKLKEDKLAAFPFLFSFFCLIAIAAGRVGCGQDISSLQRMWGHWMEEMSQAKLTSCMNPFSPQSVLPPHRFGFNSIFFSLLWNLTPK